MALIRILLIFFLIYLVVRMLGRMLFPETQRSSNNNYYYRNENDGPSSREGEVHVEGSGNPDKKKGNRNDVGEYVDYEEVD